MRHMSFIKMENSEVLLPRLGCTVPSKSLSEAVNSTCILLKIYEPTPEQKKSEFLQGRDVLVVLPTREGKSLCFATLPLCFDFIRQFIAAHETLVTHSTTYIGSLPFLVYMSYGYCDML